MRWFTNLPFHRKLVVSFGLLSGFAFAVNATIGWSLWRMNQHVDALADVHADGLYRAEMADMLFTDAVGDLRETARSGRTAGPGLLARVTSDLARSDSNFAAFTRRAGTDSIARTGAAAQRLDAQMAPTLIAVARHLEAGRMRDANALLDSLAGQIGRVADLVDIVTAGKRRLVEDEQTAAADGFRLTMWTTGLGIVALGLITGLVGVLLVRSTLPRLQQLVLALRRVANGDLTAELPGDASDEIGEVTRALGDTLRSQRTAIGDAQHVAETARVAAAEMREAIMAISKSAQDQAASLEQTAASLEEMTTTIARNAQNAERASVTATRARDAAQQGGAVMTNATAAMDDITRASQRISEITSTIDEIAFQTSLLALNAAVEAARAGQQGRGFAVVAAEVRKLAQRSSVASQEIRRLIADAAGKVEHGTELVRQSAESLQEIVVAVKQATDLVGEIAASSREQAEGVGDVNRAVSQMDEVTQTNASSTEKLNATAELLAERAAHLHAALGGFRVGGTQTPPSTPPRTPRNTPRSAPRSAPRSTPARTLPHTPAQASPQDTAPETADARECPVPHRRSAERRAVPAPAAVPKTHRPPAHFASPAGAKRSARVGSLLDAPMPSDVELGDGFEQY